MGLNYVNITQKGCEGWLNLFVDDHVIALVDNVYLADKIRAEIPEQIKKFPPKAGKNLSPLTPHENENP